MVFVPLSMLGEVTLNICDGSHLHALDGPNHNAYVRSRFGSPAARKLYGFGETRVSCL